MSQIDNAFETTMEKLWENKKYNTLRDVLVTMQPAQVAALFAMMPDNAPAPLFRLLPKEQAAETFVEMEPDMQEKLIRSFSDTELKSVLDELYVDDAVDLVEEMPANVVKRLLAQADPDMRKSINELLRYPEDSAGSIMTIEFVALRPQMTAADAIASIRRTGMDKETVNNCYIIDESRHLLGVVSLRGIVMAREDARMQDIMETNVISVTTQEDQESVAHLFSVYDLNVLPVVDTENRMVGIVTVDDAIDVIEEEATEDISKMAAITPSDRPYLKTSVWTLWKSRIPWLLLLMLSATFSGMIITHFEGALAACVEVYFIQNLFDYSGAPMSLSGHVYNALAYLRTQSAINPAVVLLVALGMDNYITAMMTAAALLMLALWRAAAHERAAAVRTALMLLPIGVGLLISVIAPGNSVRMAADGAHESGLIGEDPQGIPNNLMPYITQVASGRLEKLHIFGNDYDTPDGTGVRDYIHVVDLAKGHVAACDYAAKHNGCEIINLGTGVGYSVLDIVNTFSRVNQVPVPYVIGPRRDGDVDACYADPTKAKELLGWTATKTLEDMCRDSWRWQKANPNGYQDK